jgi:hypothetical protein
MTSLIFTTLFTVFTVTVVMITAYRTFNVFIQQNKKIKTLQNQVAALSAGAVGLDNRVLQFEQALNKMKEHQHTIDVGIAPAHNYEQAVRLARKGMDTTQLMDNCNLSAEEAHLISRLHGAEANSSALH